MVNPIKSIMKKILAIVILQLFLVGLVSGQSISDIRKLKKQYESLLQNQDKIRFQSDEIENDVIYCDLPIKQDLELKQTKFEEDEDEDS